MEHSSRPKFQTFIGILLFVCVLYVARELFIPLALASLFTFLLNPLVKKLVCLGLPRVAAAVCVSLVCFCTLMVVVWLLGGELGKLASDLADYRKNIRARVEALQQVDDNTVLQRLRDVFEDVRDAGSGASTADERQPAPPSASGESMLMKFLNMVVPTLATAFATASVVILFVFFMLLRLDEISQRIMRVMGNARLTVTRKAVDEATERISHYLLMQGTVNTIYGILLATGLFVIGLPYVILWGVLAAMFRFIPYLGPWLVSVLPIALSLAVFEGWTMPLAVVGWIVLIELVTNMILEPVLYGHSAGVSDFALLVAIAFWTWMWGGVGLLLAVPLTVCIVVICKYVPSLRWVHDLVGEHTAMEPHLTYYQYHLAEDESMSQSLIESSIKRDGFEKTLERIMLPGVALTHWEEMSGNLTREEAADVFQSMRNALTMVAEKSLEASPVKQENAAMEDGSEGAVRVLGRALHGEGDALALDILAEYVSPRVEMQVFRGERLTGELVEALQSTPAEALCISALPPRSQYAAVILCRRLRRRFPELRIMVCRWGVPKDDGDPRPFLEAGATWVVTTLAEARQILEPLSRVAPRPRGE